MRGSPERFFREERSAVESRIRSALETYPAHAARDQERLVILDWLLSQDLSLDDSRLESLLRALADGQISVPNVWPGDLARDYASLLLAKRLSREG